jgi:hypothetical protein
MHRVNPAAALMLARLDHLVYATPDVEATVEALADRLGVRATAGGRHPGRGTRNALLAIGPRAYLEIVGPDPAQATTDGPRWFGIDALDAPRLVTWAANARDLPALARDAAAHGLRMGPVTDGSRRTAAGDLLRWTFTEPALLDGDALVPFFIDWGSSPHPATTAAPGLTLISLRGRHPEPDRIGRQLAVLGIDLPIDRAPRPGLVAVLETPRGEIALE